MIRRVIEAVAQLVREGEPWAYEEDDDLLASPATDGWFAPADAKA